jgi:hypothetical protein
VCFKKQVGPFNSQAVKIVLKLKLKTKKMSSMQYRAH